MTRIRAVPGIRASSQREGCYPWQWDCIPSPLKKNRRAQGYWAVSIWTSLVTDLLFNFLKRPVLPSQGLSHHLPVTPCSASTDGLLCSPSTGLCSLLEGSFGSLSLPNSSPACCQWAFKATSCASKSKLRTHRPASRGAGGAQNTWKKTHFSEKRHTEHRSNQESHLQCKSWCGLRAWGW